MAKIPWMVSLEVDESVDHAFMYNFVKGLAEGAVYDLYNDHGIEVEDAHMDYGIDVRPGEKVEFLPGGKRIIIHGKTVS